MNTPPMTYAAWVTVLDRLAAGMEDEAVLHEMRAGSLAWQSGVAERFTQRFSDAVNVRINRASDHFSRAMGRASDASATIGALLSLRRTLRFLHDVVDIPAFPAETRGSFIALVQDAADRMQESLEDSAQRDRSGRMASIVRGHRVNMLR